ncbi:MAG: SRP54-type protein [Lentinula lateritia]|nr:MAG: SRP54-type protein [Lentinula lateritia]
MKPNQSLRTLRQVKELKLTFLRPICSGYWAIWHSGKAPPLPSRSFTPEASHIASSAASPVNSLIREASIESRTTGEKHKNDGYAVKWTFVNDLGLIFVVAYQQILQLSYVDELLAALKAIFVKLFQPFLTTFVASLHADSRGNGSAAGLVTSLNLASAFEGPIHMQPVLESPPFLDDQSTEPSQSEDATQHERQTARNVEALKSRSRGRGGRRGERPSMQSVESGSGRDSVNHSECTTSERKTTKKAGRKWGDKAPTEADMDSLDYSAEKSDLNDLSSSRNIESLLDEASMSSRNKDGLYEVKDWEFEVDNTVSAALKTAEVEATSTNSGTVGTLSCDLNPVLEAMKQHLVTKNVAKEIADKFNRKKVTNNTVRMALSTSITRILTSKISTDLLLSIPTKLSSPLTSTQQRIPYSMTFVGVNGVGNSTNLSKNSVRVLIAMCDTFRSGALEQVRVHVRNLSVLGLDGTADSKGRVELFERGYGEDAAGIAKEAISYAHDNDFDVVLIDTAGRMQDNEPIVHALAKLVTVNNCDKIIFVRGALVGNEAVDQLKKFDRAMCDFSSGSGSGKEKGIDRMLVTKWDTLDDKVAAALSTTYVTGQPIIFVGCGQTYTDLQQLTVSNIVQANLSN